MFRLGFVGQEGDATKEALAALWRTAYDKIALI